MELFPTEKKQTNKSIPPQDSPHQRVQKQQLHPWVSHHILWISIMPNYYWFMIQCNSWGMCLNDSPFYGRTSVRSQRLKTFEEVESKSLPGRHEKSSSWNLNQIKAHINYLFLRLETSQRTCLLERCFLHHTVCQK